MMRKAVYNLLVLSLALFASKAFSSSVDYSLTDPSGDLITFSIPLPLSILSCNFFGDTSCFSAAPVNLMVDGSAVSGETVDFFIGTPGPYGGLVIQDGSSVLINQGGLEISPGMYQTLYSGTLANPTLENFTNLQLQGYGYGSPLYDESFVLNATGAPSETPEPGSIFLLGSGLLGMAGAVRRKFAR